MFVKLNCMKLEQNAKRGKSDQTWEHQWKSTSQNSCLSLGHVNMPHFQLTVGSSSFDFA